MSSLEFGLVSKNLGVNYSPCSSLFISSMSSIKGPNISTAFSQSAHNIGMCWEGWTITQCYGSSSLPHWKGLKPAFPPIPALFSSERRKPGVSLVPPSFSSERCSTDPDFKDFLVLNCTHKTPNHPLFLELDLSSWEVWEDSFCVHQQTA